MACTISQGNSAKSSPVYRAAYEAGLAPVPRRRLRPALISLAVASAFASSPLSLLANPAGGAVILGTASMVSNGNQLLVTTTNGAGTNRSVINWQSFSIPSGSGTYFQQPGTSSVSINRVLGNNPSSIFGTLGSNGQLVLVNPAGITVGAGAVVDTAGFTAAAMVMTDADALAGRLRFGNGALGGQSGVLTVQGNIVARGGDVVLIAPSVEVANTALVEAQGGSVMLAAGQQVEVTGRGLEGIQLQVQAPTDSAVNLGTLRGDAVGIFAGQLQHSGLIQATGASVDGGKVVLSATSVADISGTIEARRFANAASQGGSVTVSADVAVISGTIDVSSSAGGTSGGTVSVQAGGIIQSGSINASGVATGGSVQLIATRSLLQTSSATVLADAADGAGGSITLNGGAGSGVLMSSAQVSASGSGAQGTGGTVQLLGGSVSLQAAQVSADGDAGGGLVQVGGGSGGQDPNVPNSQQLYVNASSQISASARSQGKGGSVVLWSEGTTGFYGSIAATGAGVGGNGGSVEVSGGQGVQFGGMVTAAGGPGGANGSLLLDPKNITITSTAGGLGVLQLTDPNPNGTLGSFGSSVYNLSGNSVLVTDSADNAGGTNAGAIYLFNKSTGALQSALTGSHSNDSIGGSCTVLGSSSCLYASPTSTLLFQSSSWNGGVGAWTFINAASPPTTSGVVSASNSLIGTAVGDLASATVSFASGTSSPGTLIAPYYGGGRGAIANISASGTTGTLSTANALMGSLPGDNIGLGGTISYGSTQWLVKSPSWNSAAGALTLINPLAITPGTLSAGNSLVGAAAGDTIGSGGIYNFSGLTQVLVSSPNWAGGKGAFTVASLTTNAGGLVGTVGTLNSLTGNLTSDGASFSLQQCYGSGCGYAYQAGIYNYQYNNFLLFNTNASGNGSLTLLTPASSAPGAVSSSNSLVGSTAGDFYGAQLNTSWGSGAVSVLAPNWHNGTVASAGALTVTNLASMATGSVGSGNSLVGSTTGDFSGASLGTWGGTALALTLPNWTNGTITGAGAFLLGNMSSMPTGTISSSNSIVGTATGDLTGTSLTEYGNYNDLNGQVLLLAPNYGGGTTLGTGAAILLNIPTGSLSVMGGTLSYTNALVGSTAGDHVGSGGVDTSQLDYWMIKSPSWNNGGTAASAGAVTFFEPNGTTLSTGSLATGTVSGYSNSWVGANAGDQIGTNTQLTIFNDHNGLLVSRNWGGGMGAITPIADLAMPWGTISAGNSYVGTTTSDGANMTVNAFDKINGSSYYTPDSVVVSNPYWNGSRGAVTYINSDYSTLASFGAISASNSLVGSTAGDHVGSGGITILPPSTIANAPTVIVSSPYWSKNGSVSSAGAYTFFNATLGAALGAISTTDGNTLYGNFTNDLGGATLYTSQTYPYYVPAGAAMLIAPNYNAGAGAVAFVNVATPSAGNAVLSGTSTSDHIGSGGIYSVNGYASNQLVLKSPSFGSGAGALTYMNTASFPTSSTLSAANSLIGGTTLDNLGGSQTSLSTYSGKLLVLNQAGAGSITLVQNPATMAGVVGNTNSLVGSTAGDLSGSSIVSNINNSGVLFLTMPSWDNGTLANAGAITRIDTTSTISPAGSIGSSNSLVGAYASDGVGSNGVVQASDGYYIQTPNWNGGVGAITFFGTSQTMPTGAVGGGNSLVGTAVGDLTGLSLASGVGSGQRLLIAPNYGSGKGAASMVSLSSATSGTLNSSNALVGSAIGDHLGSTGAQSLNSTYGYPGNYWGIYSPSWSSGAGAITVFNSTTGLPTGTLSSANSLVGQVAGDGVGTTPSDYLRFSNGEVLFLTRTWGGGKGALTLVPSLAAANGVVTASNSLVGTSSGDGSGMNLVAINASGNSVYTYYVNQGYYGYSATQALVYNSNYNGSQGMVTLIDSTQPTVPTGVISAANALVGSSAGDYVGSNYSLTGTGGLFVFSPYWNGARGAVTYESLGSFITGSVSAANSLVGVSANDRVGISYYASPYSLTTGSGYYLADPYFNGGLGALTFLSNTGTVGQVSSANSVIGTVAGSGGYAPMTATPDGPTMRVQFGAGSGSLMYVSPATGSTAYSGGYGFANSPSADATIAASTITAMTNAGTNVLLQANTDIFVNAPIISTAGTGVSSPGGLELEAGRSLQINANINMGGGGLALVANSSQADPNNRDPGAATLNTAPGVTLSNAGDGITVLMDAGVAGATGGSVSLGNVNAAGLQVINWSTTAGAGVQQQAGTSWQLTGGLRLQTTAANGNIGSASAPITNSAPWMALQTTNGSAYLVSTAANLAITDVVPTIGNSGGNGSGSGNDPGKNINFTNVLVGGNGSLSLRAAGNINISATNSAVSVSSLNALNITAGGNISVQGGSAAGASATVASVGNAQLVAGGLLNVRGGSGQGAFALVDPTATGYGMDVSASGVNIQGGSGSSAYAALASAGGPLSLSASSLTLASGSGGGADALVLSPNAQTLLASFSGICAGCTYLGVGDPRSNGTTDQGFATINLFTTQQQAASSLLTQQGSNLLDTFETLWDKQKTQNQGGVVVEGNVCK